MLSLTAFDDLMVMELELSIWSTVLDKGVSRSEIGSVIRQGSGHGQHRISNTLQCTPRAENIFSLKKNNKITIEKKTSNKVENDMFPYGLLKSAVFCCIMWVSTVV